MTFYFHGLIDFVGSHPHFAFVAVFLLALSEAIPVIGTVVPGSTLILAISALASTADVTPWPVIVAEVVGAIVGDGLSFWLGHQYHRDLEGWPLNRFPGAIHRSAQFISRYGVASVFLARFTAVVRAFVPLLAGTLRMSSQHFYVANIYREQTVAEATGASSRFRQIHDEYKKAPEVTRQRMYLETHGTTVRRHRQGHHRFRCDGWRCPLSAARPAHCAAGCAASVQRARTRVGALMRGGGCGGRL